MSGFLANGRERTFGVLRDLGVGDEFSLHEVLTWRSMDEAMTFACSGGAGRSKRVVLGERGGVIAGGMHLVVGSPDSWLVKLAEERPLAPLRPGSVISVLEQQWRGGAGAALWLVSSEVSGHITVTPEGKGMWRGRVNHE